MKNCLNKLIKLCYLNTFLFPIIQLFTLPLQVASEEFYNVILPNGTTIKAELAVDKARGLQGRNNLCSQCGMLFVFEREGIYNFWMKDTLINLAIIWIDSKGRITNIVQNAQPCKYEHNPNNECKVYSSMKPSKYVLEINPSDAEKLNINMIVSIPLPSQ